MKIYALTILTLIITLFSQDPLLETGFESDPFSEGWSVQTTGAGWILKYKDYTYTTVNSGSYSMAHMDDTGLQDDWLITPVITLPNDSSLLLTFYESSMFVEYIGSHEVAVTTNGGSDWTRLISTVPVENEFNKVFLRLYEFLGQDIQIGWHYTGDFSDQWFIDDVRLVYDDQPPVISGLSAEESLLPEISTYVSNDMELKLELYDRSLITKVKGYYSFNDGTDLKEFDFGVSVNRFVYYGTIPAKEEVSDGFVKFYIEDEYGNSRTSGNYNIHFIKDERIPEIINVRGTLAVIGNNADLTVTFKDFSKITSCKGQYSKDNFVTQYNFDLNPEKINYYNYKGIIPAENEIVNDGKLKFLIEDIEGNILSSEIYSIKWIESYSQLHQFDLRTSLNNNYVSSVKNQPNGTCWMYSTCALIESNLLMTGNWSVADEQGEPDLSEQHMSWWFGFNEFFNADADPVTGDGLVLHLQGGYFLNAAYMMRGEGAVRQTDANNFAEPPDRFSEYYHIYYPRSVEWFPMDAELNGIETIKQKVVEFGAVGVTLQHTSYDPVTFIHYQSPESPYYFSHGVSIIGWDDEKITQAPEGPGAWYCKNSWGEDFGFDGFYWVSYYDKHACRSMSGAASFQNVERMKYDDVYYHDYHGYSSVLPGITEAFNAFTVRENGKLSAVSFFNAVNDVDYTVKIYSDFSGGELTGLLSETSGHIDFKGYHTIDLFDPPTLYQGSKFYIYLDLSDGGQPIDQTSYVQVAYLWYTSKASPGESFYFDEGEWKDLYYNTTIASPGTANFCIKGLTINQTGISDAEIPGDTKLFQNYPNPFNPSTVIKYSIARASQVELNIYNINGQFVSNLINKKQETGLYNVEFNADELTAGMYFYRLKIDGKPVQTKKMMLVK